MTTSPYPSVTDELIAELEGHDEGTYPIGTKKLTALLIDYAELKKDAARLEWLADNLRMDFGTGELARWAFDGLPHVISDREGCLVRDLRDFIDQQRMIEND